MATITVDRFDDVTADDGQTTLREAVALANDGDRIEFARSGRIELAQGELVIAQSLSVDGDLDDDGARDIVLDAGGTGRVARIQQGQVVLEGLTITGAHTSSGSGSEGALTIEAAGHGILRNVHIRDNYASGVGVERGRLDLVNSIISDNFSIVGAGGVGGVGVFRIVDSVISNNTAEFIGGGLDLRGSVEIVDSVISDNRALNEYGGGMRLFASARYGANGVTVVNSTISGNSAPSGGGIFAIAREHEIVVANTVISGNTASDAGGFVAGRPTGLGGGVYVRGGEVKLVNATVAGNQAREGGGAFVLGDFMFGRRLVPGGELTLVNSTLTGNAATDAGGGLAVEGVATIANTLIAGNEAAGGAQSAVEVKVSDLGTPGVVSFEGVNVFSEAGVGRASFDIVETDLARIFAGVGADPNTGVMGGLLADNGGAVETVALAADGVAENAGSDADLPADLADLDGDGDVAEPIPFDGRGAGFGRIENGASDVGAFETAPEIVLAGGPGDDDLAGLEGNDMLSGEAGDDLLSGGAGDDVLAGGNGDDVLAPGAGADMVLGGAGADRVDYGDASGPVLVHLTRGYAEVGGARATLTEIEGAAGGDGDDVLIGDADANVLMGGAGDDRIDGRAGADRMEGGPGDDIYMIDDPGDVVVEQAGGGNDRINAFADFAVGPNVEHLVGLFAATGLELIGTDGRQQIIGSNLIPEGDIIRGRAGDDRLIGLVGDDVIDGGTGNDRIFGNSGDDVLFGAAGDDRLTGQFGADRFVMRPGDQNDRITDFNARGDDVLDLTAHGFGSFAEVQALMSDTAAGALIDLDGPDSVLMEGFAAVSLQAADVLI